MLTHLWRDSEINQMPDDGEIGKYTIPKGYVNATQMAKANKKLLADYMRLKSTSEYLQALSHDMGIPISSLVIEVEGRASSQATWVHPEIGIDIARWVSVEFRIWANRTLMKVFLGQETVPQPLTQIQLLAAIAAQMALQEQRLLEQEQRQQEILYRLKAVEVEQDRYATPCGHKYTVVGFATLQGVEISAKEASAKGRKASALCRKTGVEIERIHDPRFGRVGLYPESILIEVFSHEQKSALA